MNPNNVQVPACSRCSVGVMDADNPHLTDGCLCGCHRRDPDAETNPASGCVRVVDVFGTGRCARVDYDGVSFHVDLATGVVGWMSDWSRADALTTIWWTGFGLWASPDSVLVPELLAQIRAHVGGDR